MLRRWVSTLSLAVLVLLGSCSAGRRLTITGEAVTFRTQDGFLLSGFIFGEGQTGVVLVHDSGQTRSVWEGYARELAAAGNSVMTFDLRGHGDSQGTRDDAPFQRDIAAAAARLDKKASRIVVLGAGIGGSAALGIDSDSSEIEGIVALSPQVRAGNIDVLETVGTLKASKLILASVDDQEGVQAAEAIFKAAAFPRELELSTGDRVGTDMLVGPGSGKTKTLIIDFINSFSQ